MVSEVLETMIQLAEDGMTMIASPLRWDLPGRSAAVSYLWKRGRIVEVAPPTEFFNAPKTDRAREFLGRILGLFEIFRDLTLPSVLHS